MNALAFQGSTPIGSGCDGTGVCTKTNQHGFAAMAFAHELTDVEFTLAPHGRCARLTHMRVVRPHNDLPASTLSIQVSKQRLKCHGHLAITPAPTPKAPT